MATAAQRAHLHALMEWTLRNEPKIHYEQRRPMQLQLFTEQALAERFAAGKTVIADCSEFVTALCKWAGLADPNGNRYNGDGYTGTMLGYLKHYTDPRAAQIGALVVYGPGDGDHVSMVMEPGHDPWLCSHGSDAGPVKIRLSAQRAHHRAPVTFLSIAHL